MTELLRQKHLISSTECTMDDGRICITSIYNYNGKNYTRKYIKIKKEEALKRGPKLGSKHKKSIEDTLLLLEKKKKEIENNILLIKNTVLTNNVSL